MKSHSPPRLANWLLGSLLPAKDRQEIMGDLAEEWSFHVQFQFRPVVVVLGASTALHPSLCVE